MKYRSHRHAYILRSAFVSHGTNIQGMTFLLSNCHRDIMHNHWTMKYGSHGPTFILRSLFVSHGTNIHGRTFLYQIVFEI